MRKRRRESDTGDSWLNTYADMVTLLLTFFAVLLSMSNTDQNKFNAFIKSFSNLPPEVVEQITNPTDNYDETTVVTDMEELFRLLNNYVEKHDSNDEVELSFDSGIIYIRFSTTLFFEPDEYVLRQDSLPVLDFISAGLKEYEDKIRMVNVIGYTATVPNGTSYWMLSGERAATVATYFNNKNNFDPQKLTVMGMETSILLLKMIQKKEEEKTEELNWSLLETRVLQIWISTRYWVNFMIKTFIQHKEVLKILFCPKQIKNKTDLMNKSKPPA